MAEVYIHPKAFEMMKSMRVVTDRHITDFYYAKRTWKERLFTLPWRPWKREEAKYCPMGYVMPDGVICVSPRTKAILDNMP